MSKEELRALVSDFRNTLEGLERSGCTSAGAGACAPPPEVSESQPKAHSLATIREDLGDCQRCPLSETRNAIVYGAGSEHAPLMFVGEAPGAEEDRTGQPFVGKAGQLLDKMIVAMGYTREEVYIANVLKCRPPQNRDPKANEIAACQNFLSQQIKAIEPRVLVTLGKPAAHLLLESTQSMGSLRGVWQSYAGIPLMPTYHPAYLLRDPSKKREAWSDLQQVMQRLAE